VLRPNGRLFVAVPYANSYGGHQDPTHTRPGFNEATFHYFCPLVDEKPSRLYGIYKPKPFKILGKEICEDSYCNVVMEPLKRLDGGPVKLQVA
jgi:hypothetical protein